MKQKSLRRKHNGPAKGTTADYYAACTGALVVLTGSSRRTTIPRERLESNASCIAVLGKLPILVLASHMLHHFTPHRVSRYMWGDRRRMFKVAIRAAEYMILLSWSRNATKLPVLLDTSTSQSVGGIGSQHASITRVLIRGDRPTRLSEASNFCNKTDSGWSARLSLAALNPSSWTADSPTAKGSNTITSAFGPAC